MANLITRRLVSVRQWCARHPLYLSSDFDDSWRTDALRPVSAEELERRLDGHGGLLGEDDCAELVELVNARRENLLNCHHSSTVGRVSRGRLLVYVPDWNLCDGASEHASYGFLDHHNMPPWDTWVAYVSVPMPVSHSVRRWRLSGYLLSWVPDALVSFVGQGIYINPEQCIEWFDRWDDAGELRELLADVAVGWP